MTSCDCIRALPVALIVTGGLLVSGCTTGVERADVEGRVTSSGQPAVGVQVTFEPVEGRPGDIATGVTDDAGRYRLVDPTGGTGGAIVGPNRVTLNVFQEVSGDEFTALPKNDIPLRFRDGSTITEVPPEGIRDADFAY